MITYWALRAARAVAAAGLGVDACVHLNLASLYAEGGGTISEGLLFRAEAAIAIVAALAIAVSARRAACLGALAVARPPGPARRSDQAMTRSE
ncbi:MAG: hypothetical protein LBI49_09210 [Nocardiopsaceae bacterium]|nr:hypothetical protein [Nocardiopsaceae bacterium]